jgi:hypothetical protein
VNQIGIVAILQDWEKLETIYNSTPAHEKPRNLYPTQFREQAAQALYLSAKNWQNRAFLKLLNPEGEVYLRALPLNSGKDWDSNLNELQYAKLLSATLESDLDNVWLENTVIQLTKKGDNFMGRVNDFGFIGFQEKPLWPYS